MKLEAEVKSIKKILVDDEMFYQIPDYQRPYSWDKENLSELVDDLVTAYKTKKEEMYFCGSLVLVKNSGDSRYDIIDGQQRATTFSIFACVIRDAFSDKLKVKAKDYIVSSIQDKYEEDKRKLKFLTEEKYQIDFEETVLKKINFEKVKSFEKTFKDNKYLQNAHFIKRFFSEQVHEHDIDVNDFTIWFYENIVLTVIVCPNEDSAIQIFNVLNDRGMPLSSIDILKASLMQNLHSKEDRSSFKTKWSDINSSLKYYGLDMYSMLNTFLYYKIAKNPKNRLDKELLATFKNEGKSSLSIIKEISDFSDKYIITQNLDDKYIYCLQYLRHKIYWNSIICTALHTNYAHIDELKELLVAYYYQNWVAGATVARIKQTSFNILRLVKNNQAIEEIKIDMKENLSKYSTTKSFREELDGSWVYGRKWDRAILLLVEYFSTDNSNPNFISIGSKLHLEHILPQTANEEWKEIFTKDERELWTNSLANLTLLSMRKNIQASNFAFEKKKEIYSNADDVVTSFEITKSVLASDKWDAEELRARHKKLTSKILDKLDVFKTISLSPELEHLL